MTTTRAETIEVPGGYAVTGIVTHHGYESWAGGGHVDPVFCYCYPKRDGCVTTWAGPIIHARAEVTCEYRQWNPFSRYHERRICWRVTFDDGRIYTGRNGGPEMLLKARRLISQLRKDGLTCSPIT